MSGRTGNRRLALTGMVAIVAIAAFLLWHEHPPSRAAGVAVHESHPQTTWVACNRNADNTKPSTFHPLSDQAAAALITRQRETRPDNDRAYAIDGVAYPAPNDYVPSAAQIRDFRSAKTSAGQSLLQFNPYQHYVDGGDGIRSPSTDDLIQWAAHKWGIPEDWLRAEYVHESYWNQFMLGDDTPVSAAAYRQYPAQSRVAGSQAAYQSLGITQERWAPDGSLNAGSEPLRWLSTAFNIDYQAATLRFYYDDPSGARKAWNDHSYEPCQQWNSVGGWFRPYPWANPDQASYVSAVKHILAGQDWTHSTFVDWSPASLPPGLKFKK